MVGAADGGRGPRAEGAGSAGVQLGILRQTNTLVLTLAGAAGGVYALEWSADFRGWTALATNTADAQGHLEWRDSLGEPAPTLRCYRARAVGPASDPTRLAIVALNNVEPDQPIFFMMPGNLAPIGVQVDLLGGPLGGVLTPVYMLGPHRTLFSVDQYPGYFDAGTGAVPGALGNETVQLQMRAWLGADTYEAAILRWESPVWEQTTGTWDSTLVPPQPPLAPSLTIPAPAIIQLVDP